MQSSLIALSNIDVRLKVGIVYRPNGIVELFPMSSGFMLWLPTYNAHLKTHGLVSYSRQTYQSVTKTRQPDTKGPYVEVFHYATSHWPMVPACLVKYL